MKLKTNIKIKELDGQESKDLTVGKAIANIILFVKTDPLRAYIMATKVYSEEEYEISMSDYEWIKTAIIDHGSEVYTNALVSGQLLLILSELKEDSKKKKEVKE
jgi:hypothetical protein